MKEYLKKNISKIILLFILLQPFLDFLTAISIYVFKTEITIGMIGRVCFLIFLIFYNICMKNFEKRSFLYHFILALYAFLFVANVFVTKDISAIFYEIKNIARYLYFPLLLLNLYEIKKNENLFISEKMLTMLYTVYLLFIFIPLLTHTDFVGYFEGKVGTIGWFHSTNEIAAILSSLLPLVIFGYKNRICQGLFLFLIGIVFFSLGSKITIVSLLITLLFFLVQYGFSKKEKKKVVPFFLGGFFLLIVLGTFFLPRTNFYKNIQIHLDFLEVDNIFEVFTKPELIDHFVFSSRLSFLQETNQNYLHSPLSSKLVGIGFIENFGTDEVNLKTIEMDIFDLFYRLGIFGFILVMIPFVKILKENWKKRTSKEKLSIFLFLFISFLAGHVLTSPAVSIYLSILILGLWREDELCKQPSLS